MIGPRHTAPRNGTPNILALIPYAAEAPFEIWIIPKWHLADFDQITDAAQLRDCR